VCNIIIGTRVVGWTVDADSLREYSETIRNSWKDPKLSEESKTSFFKDWHLARTYKSATHRAGERFSRLA
jgi:hypothetical protein